ncbi:hypothetical protein [Singulisphaera sp. PoT]|uniref:hypothetical protein n=1 Tax=Singulisphaera sp. PoT TaxID=3411797 RepID=UPI003BF5DF3B
MRGWWRDLDRILRGEATKLSSLRRGTIEIPAGGITFVLILLSMFYGACMGSFSLLKESGPETQQLVASTVKVPALFVMTLLVTFPSLYVFNALVGSRLQIGAALKLLVASLAVMISVLASLGPIVAFFSASTTTYSFMILINVVVFGLSGVLGLIFLLRTLHRLSLVVPDPETEATEFVGEEKGHEGESGSKGALEPITDKVLGRHVKTIFRCWVLLFGIVGAQMSWVLRPFIGNPARPFTWFRGRDSNFFEAVWGAIASLFT